MTTNLEKQFFDTFGIEPDVKSCYRRCYHKCDTKSYLNCKDCDKATVIYPQITDRILLELICIGTQFFAELVLLTSDNIEDLKEQVLTIYLKTAYKEKIKHQVQELFKE